MTSATGKSEKIRPKKWSMDLATRKSGATLAREILVQWWEKQSQMAVGLGTNGR